MKKLVYQIAIALICLGVSSCGNSAENTTSETTTTTSTQAESTSSPQSTPDNNQSQETKEADIYSNEKQKTKPTNTANQTNSKSNNTNLPKVGTIKQMVSGDLKCYVTLIDEKGNERQVGATFEICEQQNQFLGKKVNLSYEDVRVNDCQSAEPCGKTKIESLISKMELVGDKSSTTSNQTDSYTISNKEWTITIGNRESWSGVNGTGNLSYRGCDSQGKCLELNGGKVTCREGICITGWKNGEYAYIVKRPITEDGTPGDASSATLEVRKGDKTILTATDFQPVN